MGRWITADGSSGFTIDGNILTYDVSHIESEAEDEDYDNVLNAMWQDGDGVSSGKHYWKFEFLSLDGEASVGLTSKDHFKRGYCIRAIEYLGNLSNGYGCLIGNFGPAPKEGDVIGILAVFEDDRLKVYIDVNAISLGLAFSVPASTFKSIFPFVSFHEKGSATCTKQLEIPNNTSRIDTIFTGIEGDWRLIDLKENGIASELPCSVTSKITKMPEPHQYSWGVKVVNFFETVFSKVDGNWKSSIILTTLMNGEPEAMKLEYSIGSLVKEVKAFELDENGNLLIQSDKMSSTWTRYGAIPEPYVGELFH